MRLFWPLFWYVSLILLSAVDLYGSSSFVKVSNGQFSRNNSTYNYMGANLWYAMNLGSRGPSGDRPRLIRELDRLQKLGVRNLRILGGSEGPDTELWRIVPSLQKSPGVFDARLFEGLDFTLAEMKKRDLTAVIMLTNFWAWSGGMSQYRRWAGAGPVPPSFKRDFIDYSSQFYSDAKAKKIFRAFVRKIVTRVNSITGVPYANDSTIMAWELANEPRGARNQKDFNIWIDSTAAYIKHYDPRHLVTTGVEGDYHGGDSGLDLIENHKSKSIDYATLHVWAQNSGIYDPLKPDETYPVTLKWMEKLVDHHRVLQKKLGKPLVLEEFGLSRESASFDPQSKTDHRDDYYSHVFDRVLLAATFDQTLSGVNFWAWGGEATPPLPLGGWWKPGDPLMGDPAHEHQGWYSVFAEDVSTLKLIKDFAQKLEALP